MATIVITENRTLNPVATNGATSTVGEPSIAATGNKMFFTANWFAARTQGTSDPWQWVDPATTTPGAAGGFCCDQLTLYDRRRRVWIWILQYREKERTNVFRIAVSRNATEPSAAWYWWDIAPSSLNPVWRDVWFDYPDAALGATELYVTFNMFRGETWQRAAVMRFPLDILANRGNLTFDWWSTTRNGSLRLTQQATPTNDMFFVSHNTTGSQIRLFSWASAATSVSWWDLDVRRWSHDISSIAPNGVDWLARCDPRITGATLANQVMTCMWTAGADANRPHPYCRVVRVDLRSASVIDQPDIWSTAYAWAYPAASVSRDGTVGFTAFCGGGGRHPGHVVGARDGSTWRGMYSSSGTHSPSPGKWGDYLICRSDTLGAKTWIASGYTLIGGSNFKNIVPRAVRFRLAARPTQSAN